MAGSVTTATTTTLLEANKVLRYAKQNGDVGLEFRSLGRKEDMTFIAFSDASFACRADNSSQGGYIVAMVDRATAEGAEGHYNVVDWRSWKLARISRSTLAAESQAASEAADSLLFTCTFWNLIWKPWLVLNDLQTPKMPVEPALIVDAKALYDLLVKPEVQASSGTDKRTTIEVLVTQDKLACCSAKTRWVSSEQQYADGLTKQTAAQLLAERLRTHMVKLKSDTTFQAAKKKTPQERQRNTKMYAMKKPQRALQAMFAMCWTGSSATYLDTTDNTTFTYNNLYLGMLKPLYTAILAIVIGLMVFGGWKIWNRADRAGQAAEEETLREASTPAVSSAETQTEMSAWEIVTLREHFEEVRRLEITMEEDMVPKYVYESMMETHHRELDIYFTALNDRLRAQEQQRSEEHTSELQSRFGNLVCRLLLEKKKISKNGGSVHSYVNVYRREVDLF